MLHGGIDAILKGLLIENVFFAIELVLLVKGILDDEPAVLKHPREGPDSGGAATESKDVDVVPVGIVTAQKLVEVSHVLTEAPTECTTEYLAEFALGGADAVVIEDDLSPLLPEI